MKGKSRRSENGSFELKRQSASEKKRVQMRRRDFVQAGLMGAAATLTAKGAVRATQEQEAATGCPAADAACQQPPLIEQADAVDPAFETWLEPWVWRPSQWPGQQLDLNVVENENPGPAVKLGNPNAVLFSYGANTPGPTVRMNGNEILYVKLRNLLGEDSSTTFVGPYPDPANGTRPPGLSVETINKASEALGNKREDFCLGEHTNGVHSVRVTNLHTHGLHVRPSRNPNGTHSDNVILRVMSQKDFNRREEIAKTAPCQFMEDPEELYFLRDDEQAGEADYEFRLGDVQRKQRLEKNEKRAKEGKPLLPPQPHPAGTFWYHPHAHGATWDQVSSGMAGYLIVEGDIDEAVNLALTGRKDPDPETKTGDYDYRERLMFFQRVLFSNRSKDPNAPNPSRRVGATPLVNGNNDPPVIKMRPGAVERWRVINGSVDGRGYKRFMVVKGQYVVRGRKLFKAELKAKEVVDPVTGQKLVLVVGDIDTKDPIDPVVGLEALEKTKQDLYQLSVDGITLLEPTGSYDGPQYRYTIKDLSQQNKGSRNPLWDPDKEYERKLTEQVKKELNIRELNCEQATAVCWLSSLESVWKDGTSIRNCFVRPNEFYMGPANRTDLFFVAPAPSQPPDITYKDENGQTRSYDVYSVLAKAVLVHSDTPQQAKQTVLKPNGRKVPPVPFPEDVVVAHIFVDRTDCVPAASTSQGCRLTENPVLDKVLPELQKVEVQDYLLPIEEDELKIPANEAKARKVPAGDFRTRIVSYSGWGSADVPLLSTYPTDPSREAFQQFLDQDGGKLKNLVYAEFGEGPGGPYNVLLPSNIRTMAVRFNNAAIERERAAAEHPDDFPYQYPRFPRKFNPNDPYRARMLEDSAEEWALYNLTDLLWGNTTESRKGPEDPVDQNNNPFAKSFKQPPTQFKEHYVSFPISRAEGSKHFLENLDFQAVTKGIDHPFHIHQNPFWVMRIEIPDENGELHNILVNDKGEPEPRWMDTIWMPRRRGRVVFRTRFPDYVGAYVHHCHILLHEDNGMMHVVEATPFEDQSNYHAQDQVATAEMTSEQVSGIYPRASGRQGYVESSRFFDPDRVTGQVYPGFEVTPPSLQE